MENLVSGIRGIIHFSPTISRAVKAQALAGPFLSCCMCGLEAGERDFITGQHAELYVTSLIEQMHCDRNSLQTLRAVCSICKQGREDLNHPLVEQDWLLAQLRQAGQEDQLSVLRWLRSKFPDA